MAGRGSPQGHPPLLWGPSGRGAMLPSIPQMLPSGLEATSWPCSEEEEAPWHSMLGCEVAARGQRPGAARQMLTDAFLSQLCLKS